MCCNGGNRQIKKLHVQRPQASKADAKKTTQRINRNSIQNASPQNRKIVNKRQALIRNDRCPECGHTIMLVNIAGRERKQCTKCRHILK